MSENLHLLCKIPNREIGASDPKTKSTVIHSISAKYFLWEIENFCLYLGNFTLEKVNSLFVDQNSPNVFDFSKREFSFSRVKFSRKG